MTDFEFQTTIDLPDADDVEVRVSAESDLDPEYPETTIGAVYRIDNDAEVPLASILPRSMASLQDEAQRKADREAMAFYI